VFDRLDGPVRCDFCRNPLARWRYPGGEHGWQACERCHQAIEAEDRETLLDRVMAQPVPRTVPDRYAARFQDQAKHERFWSSRRSRAEPLKLSAGRQIRYMGEPGYHAELPHVVFPVSGRGNPQEVTARGIADASVDALKFPMRAALATVRQRGVMAHTAHRPWPLPQRPWFMGQTWRDLLFAHWRVDPEALRRVLPPQLPPDLRDGAAWIGITPFRVEGLRLRMSPPSPFLSQFVEVNGRTYVTVQDRPGIHFLSLDASSGPAVAAARRAYRLPYFSASADLAGDRRGFRFASERMANAGPAAELVCSYAPNDAPSSPEPGSLEYFLTERYCLYTLDEQQKVMRGEIHHPPWPLQRAEGEIHRNTMTQAHQIGLEGHPLLHYAQRQDVVLWKISPVDPV
jgi:uncharacterized protein